MVEWVRRKVLGGALVGGALLGAGRAMAQDTPPPSTATATPDSPAVAPAKPEVQSADQTAPDAAAKTRTLRDTPADSAGTPVPKPAPTGQDWANLHRYHDANIEVTKLPRGQRAVVMMGDSITDKWPGLSGDFFATNNLVGRGIGGQTSAQMVLRFTPDVVALRPKVVHLMAGTNDVAENLDPYDFFATTNNLQAMITLARANGIKVVVGSVPPATSFAWKPNRGNQLNLIMALNTWIKATCAAQNLIYCDYWPVLQGGTAG